MNNRSNPVAKLLVNLPVERYQMLSQDDRAPQIGDKLVLDQGFTSEDGKPMVLAYFPAVGGDAIYEAKVYESELE